jgi:hypothetical protein
VTICFSFQTPNFIITGTDVLVRNIEGKERFNKKFIINSKRKFVVLFSGHYVLGSATRPEPRRLLIEKIDVVVSKRDPLVEVARKVMSLVEETYLPTDDIKIQLHFCGFDGNTPRIYLASTTDKKPLKNLHDCLTGDDNIIEYRNTVEGQRQICLLKSIVPQEAEILVPKVRQFIENAISYENQKAAKRGTPPTTGGGVNIVTLYPQRVVWSAPRADPQEDPYKISVR